MWLAGPHIRPQDARPGDLLFWANDPAAPQDIDHVALYLGNGQMVAAPHTGDVVHVSPVYSNNFQGVVRIDPAAATRLGGPLWTST
jgi:cell wall-associated NlpC family hydrolase